MSRSDLPYRSLESQSRWRALVAAFESSGLSMPGFCQREGIAESSFYAWRARLRSGSRRVKTRTPGATRGFVQLGVMGSGAAQAVELPSGNGSALEIKLDLGAGVVLHLRRG